jgi:hypothetical protein
MSELIESLGPLTPDADGHAELRSWLARFADLHRHYGPVIRAWTEAEIDASSFGRAADGVLGDLAAALGKRIAASPGLDIDPRVAALALVAMIERSSYYKLTGQLGAVDDDQLIDASVEIAARAASGPKELVVEIKRSLHDMRAIDDADAAMERELGPQVWSREQPWFAERLAAIKARVQKKKD